MYSALRKKKGYSCREFAEILKTEFPAANAAGVSLAERPEESGVTYTAEARSYINGIFGITKKQENRKSNKRLSCWVPESVKEVFETSKVMRGFNTDHDYIIFLIMQDRAVIEKAARSGGTEQSGKEKYIETIITKKENLSND